MDAQLKRGLLEVCVLTAIKKEDSYGYKIIKDISDYLERSESTLYPILKRLENSGCITVYTVEHNSRLRKYYSITNTGKGRIYDFLEEWKSVMKAYDFIKGECENE
ncbi:MAG: PadR family transcriptional regulator [Clostridia bacterium]|nr:PadR family transcriptional regulator [Clostridia bacterium]